MVLYLFIFICIYTVFICIRSTSMRIIGYHGTIHRDIWSSHPQDMLKMVLRNTPELWTQPYGRQIQVCPKSKARWWLNFRDLYKTRSTVRIKISIQNKSFQNGTLKKHGMIKTNLRNFIPGGKTHGKSILIYIHGDIFSTSNCWPPLSSTFWTPWPSPATSAEKRIDDRSTAG